jgi:hypothetical protein
VLRAGQAELAAREKGLKAQQEVLSAQLEAAVRPARPWRGHVLFAAPLWIPCVVLPQLHTKQNKRGGGGGFSLAQSLHDPPHDSVSTACRG